MSERYVTGNKYQRAVGSVLRYALLIAFAVITLFPVLWLVVSGFLPNYELLRLPPKLIPVNGTLKNFIDVFTNATYRRYFLNSFITSGGTVLLCLFVSVLAGYSLSRFRFPGKKTIETSILSVQMFPIVVIEISLYTFYLKWGLMNTYSGLILADVTFCLPLCITLMKSFFDTIPRSLDESAKIDGAGRLQTLVQILSPLVKPGAVAIGIYTFLYSWDDFLFALMIMQKPELKTLPVGLAQSFMGQYADNYAGMMAFSFAASLPVVVLFMFFQKQMVSGLTAGAVKG